MSELDLGQHSDLKVSELLDRAQLDVVRNGTTKTVAVKDLLHEVHGSDSVASAVANAAAAAAKAPPTKARSQAAPAKSVINPAMSMSSFRTHENMRLKKQAEFQQQQQRYLQQGGAPQAQDYW